MTDKRQEATKFKCKHDESITKQPFFCGMYSSLEKPFEICWSSLADEHKSLPKLTRRNINSNKFAFGTPSMTPRLMIDVNIDLRYQYGISVAGAQTSPLAKCPKGQGARRNDCFCRLRLSIIVADAYTTNN